MSSETRKITVTGGASVFRVDGGDQTSKTRRRKSTTTNTNASPQTIVKIGGERSGGGERATSERATSERITSERTASETVKAIKVEQAVPQEISNSTISAPATPQSSKVILGGKKPKHMKVILTKKNNETAPATAATSKPNRKVSLGLTHLKRRVTRARKLNKLSKTAPIEQIKKELIAAHIIKEDSKAPEHILRQMYADAKLLTSKSL